MSRVFNEHRKVLREKLKSRAFGGEATKVEEIINNLDSTARQIEQAVDWFRRERAANFLQKVSDKSRLRDGNGYFQKVVGFISHLYDNVLSTVAFQTAVMASFFSAIEQTTTIIRDVGGENADVTIEFASYLQAIDSFFIPESSAHFRRMIEVFAGNLDSDFENFRVTRTPFTFREVVYPAEMQPDQWPKYRYLILEIWQPVSATVRDVVARERDLCRAQVFASLEARKREDYLRSESKREEDLDHAERETIMKLAHEAFCTLLKSLGVERANRPTRLQLTALSATDNEAAPTTLLDEAEETWESEEPSGEGG